MLSVLEKCKEENNEEASLLLESAPVEGFLKNAIQFNSSNMLVPVEGLTLHCNLQHYAIGTLHVVDLNLLNKMQSCLALEELAGIEDKQEFEASKGGKGFEMMLNFLSFPICQNS